MLLPRTGISRVDMPVRVAFLRRQSIHLPRVGRDPARSADGAKERISIHSPRVGRDRGVFAGSVVFDKISIHSPRVGRDRLPSAVFSKVCYFNPLAPCGARRRQSAGRTHRGDFNPLAPCGARPTSIMICSMELEISIHSPRVGRDPSWAMSKRSQRVFQSTRPVWGETASRRAPSWAMSFQSTRPVWGETMTLRRLSMFS